MTLLITLIVFLYGSIFTSFYTLVGMRVPKNESIQGRSHCDQCDEKIPWYGLMPVFGWVFVKGKCLSCESKVSIKYPLYELIGGGLFALGYLVLDGQWVEFVIYCLFISLMIIVTVSDIEYKIVPDSILLIFLPFLFIGRMIEPAMSIWNSILGGVLGFLVMYAIAWYGKKRFKKDALGGGDIKLYFLIGLFLGAQIVFLSLFFASLLGLILGKVVMNKEREVPFVPFIFFGVLMTYFLGIHILEWYMGLFF